MLPVQRLVSGSFNLSPQAAAARNFNTLLILGDSSVINGLERLRTYLDLDSVVVDFGTTGPEALAATLYFGQTPKPGKLMIGRYLRTASAAMNEGGILTPTQQTLATWTAITTGSFAITIDGVVRTLTGLDFHLQTNLNGVASVIQAALPAGATCVWDGAGFIITSPTTGTASTVSYATAAGSGTDISTMLRMTAATAIALVPGYAAETPDASVAFFANKSADWYGVTFASSTQPTDDQRMTVAGLVEGLSLSRIYGITTQDPNCTSAVVTTDIGSRLLAAGYLRTTLQYSTASPYAVCSYIGREFTVDFSKDDSTITMMYKQEPGITAENLDENSAATLKAKRINVFASYINGTSIVQDGVMSGPAYFDEIHGMDWLTNNIQTACYNTLYTSNKIAQTDVDLDKLINAASGVLGQAKRNKLVAPGVWTAALEFGELKTGLYLKNGYYIFMPSVDLQSQADREARKAPPMQIAVKLAGATHTMDFSLEVNR